MANGEALTEAADLARGSDLDLGLHLNLTTGRPILPPAEVPTLVDSCGCFPGKWAFVRRALGGRLAAREVRAEIKAQLDRIRALNLPLSHFDSHHHIHLLPVVAACAAKVLREGGIGWVRRVRGPGEAAGRGCDGIRSRLQHRSLAACSRRSERWYGLFAGAEAFFGLGWYLSRDPAAAMDRIFAALRPGINEWMCHPADFAPDPTADAMAERRRRECELLCAASTRNALGEAGIELISIKNQVRK
jgi:predicted glycoside hydrolase/deacetylase ChbG (UPF0249 family)